ncbi:hypothetical protein [Methylobacterium sp. J-092]|uniref:hypothetical protein n=1 Tax=Methylobacterium sp. J-092 TaxID=2836667 RepID=UPI001FBBFB9B|nr:hypothetical protein [Methylobacterium sp. J-092]MCJ2009775.1 hypothetical protein [Methylobacterium sp. J-092]
MADAKPFQPAEVRGFPREPGDYLTPICLAGAEVITGDELGVVVLQTAAGHRIGIPLRVEALWDLHEALGKALRTLQASEGGSVQ